MAEVVNVKVLYIRPKYKNLQEWCEDDSNVYIGRGRIVFINGKRYPEADSVCANPYKGDREIILPKYEKYIREKITKDKLDINILRGKKLGCWCKEKDKDIPCHGDILLKILDENQEVEIIIEE